MSKDKIKVCPFCGEEPKINQRYTVTDWEVDNPVEELMYLVECENDKCSCYVESKMYKTKELAIKAWNTHYIDSYIEQLRWERDVAISQLEELGVGFGEKVDDKVVVAKMETTTRSKGSD